MSNALHEHANSLRHIADDLDGETTRRVVFSKTMGCETSNVPCRECTQGEECIYYVDEQSPRCAGCGTPWVRHMGAVGICRMLQETSAQLAAVTLERDLAAQHLAISESALNAVGAERDELKAQVTRLTGEWDALQETTTAEMAPAKRLEIIDRIRRMKRDEYHRANEEYNTELRRQEEEKWGHLTAGSIVIGAGSGKRYRVVRIYRDLWRFRPAIMANPERADGSFGTSLRNIGDQWLLEGEVQP